MSIEDTNHAYKEGLRDGEMRSFKQELIALKDLVASLAQDVKAQGRIIWLLCGAIALAQFIAPIALNIIGAQ
jgi:hypothetical protein